MLMVHGSDNRALEQPAQYQTRRQEYRKAFCCLQLLDLCELCYVKNRGSLARARKTELVGWCFYQHLSSPGILFAMLDS